MVPMPIMMAMPIMMPLMPMPDYDADEADDANTYNDANTRSSCVALASLPSQCFWQIVFHSLKQMLLTLDLSIKITHHLYHQHEEEEEEQIAGQCSLVPFPMSARLSLRTSSYLTEVEHSVFCDQRLKCSAFEILYFCL